MMRIPILCLFIPTILPQNVLEDVCLKHIIFPQPASKFNLRKMRHYVRFPLNWKKIDVFLSTCFMLDGFQGGGARQNCRNTGFLC